jgi:3',5'-cyclic-AMP phosphodiesterase
MTHLIILVAIILFSGCKDEKRKKDAFSMAFLTEIHLQPEDEVVKGSTQALDTVKTLNPDFVLTGGI